MSLSPEEFQNIRDSFTEEQRNKHDKFIDDNFNLTITLCDLIDENKDTEENIQSLKDAYTEWHFHVYGLMNTLYEEDFDETKYEDEMDSYISSLQNNHHHSNIDKMQKYFFEKEWAAQHVEFMNEIMEFITENDSKLYESISLIKNKTVDEKGEVTKECQKFMKDALTKWYEHTFNFTKILYEKVGLDYGSKIMEEIQMKYQKGIIQTIQTYFFENDWGKEHFEYLRNEYGDECNLEEEYGTEK